MAARLAAARADASHCPGRPGGDCPGRTCHGLRAVGPVGVVHGHPDRRTPGVARFRVGADRSQRALKERRLGLRDAVRAAATNVVTSAEDASDGTSRPFERERVLARVDLGMLLASIALSFETVVLL